MSPRPIVREDRPLAAALGAWREDARAAVPPAGLADRVAVRAARACADVAEVRRLGRVYAVAAAALLLLAGGGALLLRRPAPAPSHGLDDIEAARFALEQAVSVADLDIGGR